MKITDETIRNYKNHLITEEKSDVTIEKYIMDIKTLSQWLVNREITKQELLAYKAKLIEDYAPASVNSAIASINGFLMFHKLYDLKIKILKIQKQLFYQKEKELTKAEYERLLKAAKSKRNERLYLIMQTICGTGIRVSELKFITCEAVANHRTTVKLKGKIRTILLPKELCKLLSKYIKEHNIKSGPVFVTRSGKPLSRHDIWRSMKALCDTAGVGESVSAQFKAFIRTDILCPSKGHCKTCGYSRTFKYKYHKNLYNRGRYNPQKADAKAWTCAFDGIKNAHIINIM